MLARLSVENYALIESLEMEWSPSLNIVTGETGAGKSILLGALGLVLGNRADIAVLKDTERNCVVEGIFNVSAYGLEDFFTENDLDYDPVTTIRRVITPAGKSRAYVNDLPVQLAVLKELSSKLIDIHSQHQSLMLGDAGFRISIVDAVADDAVLRARYREVYGSLRAAEGKLSRLRAEAEQSLRDQDYIKYQYEQIHALKLREGELAEIEAEQRELGSAENIRTVLQSAEQALDNDETGVLVQLRSAEQALRGVREVYPSGNALAERMYTVLVELKDIASEVSSEAQRVGDDPARLEQLDQRLDALYTLMRRHGVGSDAELIALEKEFASKLGIIEGSEQAIAELEGDVARLRAEATELAAELTAERRKASLVLNGMVQDKLSLLGMPAARFSCEVIPMETLSSTGADEVKFLFAAGGGIGLQPLEKTASGGEVSRVMLTLKSIVAQSTMLPTIIFDEIDTGVSGRIADAMGDIIAGLAGRMQVINITHLPQVASKGDTHFLVYKDETPSGTKTLIRRLTADERIGEIAKMLSGSHVTDAAMSQARTLLGV